MNACRFYIDESPAIGMRHKYSLIKDYMKEVGSARGAGFELVPVERFALDFLFHLHNIKPAL
ncbi:hypothetical protein [Legionella geestiana]|uniref:hypothetical protein n=1 Tax=Legionella geestiana TaxID=45065 RepID=UPI00142FCE72|nr:hypothetical protein [Legionella geestiana]